eukprot:scaffold5989_cov70-Phaeocystis_antarctica.AAC.2
MPLGRWRHQLGVASHVASGSGLLRAAAAGSAGCGGAGWKSEERGGLASLSAVVRLAISALISASLLALCSSACIFKGGEIGGVGGD